MSIQGQKVRISVYDASLTAPAQPPITVEGHVIYGSDNRASLMLGFEAILDGGFVGMMPVLLGEDGVYRNIFTNHEVKIEWL